MPLVAAAAYAVGCSMLLLPIGAAAAAALKTLMPQLVPAAQAACRELPRLASCHSRSDGSWWYCCLLAAGVGFTSLLMPSAGSRVEPGADAAERHLDGCPPSINRIALAAALARLSAMSMACALLAWLWQGPGDGARAPNSYCIKGLQGNAISQEPDCVRVYAAADTHSAGKRQIVGQQEGLMQI